MNLELLAVTLASVALVGSSIALWAASKNPSRRWKRGIDETIQDLEERQKRWMGDYDEELENAKKRYREAGRIYREVADAIAAPRGEELEEGTDGGEARDVPSDDARRSQPRRVQAVPADVVASGFLGVGRSG